MQKNVFDFSYFQLSEECFPSLMCMLIFEKKILKIHFSYLEHKVMQHITG